MTENDVQEVTSESESQERVDDRPSSRNMPFAVQVGGMVLLFGAIVVGYARWKTGSIDLVWPWLQGQRLFFTETQIDLGEVGEMQIIDRRLRVANLSSQPLTLLGSQKSCGCISLDEFPIVVAAGGQHDIQLKIATSGKSGPFGHTIKFFSDDPVDSSVVVAIDGIVPKSFKVLRGGVRPVCCTSLFDKEK